jgi:hypothetical protein
MTGFKFPDPFLVRSEIHRIKKKRKKKKRRTPGMRSTENPTKSPSRDTMSKLAFILLADSEYPVPLTSSSV